MALPEMQIVEDSGVCITIKLHVTEEPRCMEVETLKAMREQTNKHRTKEALAEKLLDPLE